MTEFDDKAAKLLICHESKLGGTSGRWAHQVALHVAGQAGAVLPALAWWLPQACVLRGSNSRPRPPNLAVRCMGLMEPLPTAGLTYLPSMSDNNDLSSAWPALAQRRLDAVAHGNTKAFP
jgi:hypothetical protein